MKLCVIDFETANRHSASACSIGIMVVEEGEVLHEAVYLIRPHVKYAYFDEVNISIHGLRYEDVEGEPEFDEIYTKLEPWFKDSILMAHYAIFDMTVLRSLFKLYNIDVPTLKYIDSLEIARKVYPFLRNHKLNTVCEHLEIDLNHHEALSDAKGSCLIALNTMALIQDFDVESLIDHLNLKINYII
jgi:DNA polymerase III subunit epsilon